MVFVFNPILLSNIKRDKMILLLRAVSILTPDNQTVGFVGHIQIGQTFRFDHIDILAIFFDQKVRIIILPIILIISYNTLTGQPFKALGAFDAQFTLPVGFLP